MAVTCTNYDEWIVRWHAEVYRFCLVLALDAKTAQELTFQAYLRLGTGRPGMDETSARLALYSAAFTVSETHHLKKLRGKPSKKKLSALLGMDETEPFIGYLRMPFLHKASAYLLHIASFSPETVGKMLRVRSDRAVRLGNIPSMERIWAACSALPLSEGAQQSELSDRLYTRFSERSVAFETRMLDRWRKFDRIVPYLALFILVLCAFAVYYSLHVSANLPLE